MAKPLELARRIAAMSPNEIRTRAGMVLRQRLDALEVRWGRNPLQVRHSEHSEIIPQFFFDTGEAPALGAEIRRRLPAECESVIESAKQIQKHRFDLLGYRGLAFGDGRIEWHRDPVHGITASNEPWFRVPYLDFNRAGDHKIVWELSRHQHLMLLARAWLYTGHGEFLSAVERLWEDWRGANPYPMGINWASTLEVAFRCLSWIWVDQFTRGAADLPDGFRTRLREGIGECAMYVERYLSTYFAPNTHLLGEILTLFFVGVLYPGFKRAKFWRDYGWRGLQQESERQVREDGFHFEQSVYYHVYALDMFLHARILAGRNGIPISDSYDETLRRMAGGLAAISGGGLAPRFGDDDGGRLFDGRRNRSEHMLDPLACAAILYGRGDWKMAAGDLHEETLWLLGAEGMRVFDRLPPATHALRSRPFAASGYYTIASKSGLAVIDAGPHGWGRGGHGHADALSLQLIAGGRAWLTDPGTGSYPREKPERDLFRGTGAHNTLEVDGQSQAEPTHAFAWGTHPVTRVDCWHVGERMVVFHASHDGYSRLDPPVNHERWVIGWSDDLWMVADRATGEGVHRLDLRWHVTPECALTAGNVGSTWHLKAGQECMEISAAADKQWIITCEKGDWSPSYGQVISAPVLHFSRESALPAELVTLLALNQPGNVSLRSLSAEGANAYCFTRGESYRLVVLATQPGVWRYDTIASDARLFVTELSITSVKHMLIKGGSETRVGGNVLVQENKTDGVWETTGAATEELSPTIIKGLLEVLQRAMDERS